MNFPKMCLFFMTVSLATVSTRARYWQQTVSLNDVEERRGTYELADESKKNEADEGREIVKRSAENEIDDNEIESSTFYMSPEREEELLVGEGFGTDLEAEYYFGNITRKNCKDDDENAALYLVCQSAKECSSQASTQSGCIVDIGKACKYNEKHFDRRCVNHMMAHVKFYRDFGTGGLGPYQLAQGLTKKDIREQKEEEEDVERDRRDMKKKNKKSKKGSKAGARRSPDGGANGKNDGNALSSLLGGTKSSPGLLGGPGKSQGLLG